MSETLCTIKRVRVRGMFGDTMVSGWRLGDWAVHRQVDDQGMFCITWLPHGLSLPFDWASFIRRSHAIAAMADIVRLKNSWAEITQRDLNADLKAALQNICRRHGAVSGSSQAGAKLDEPAPFFSSPLTLGINGYQTASS